MKTLMPSADEHVRQGASIFLQSVTRCGEVLIAGAVLSLVLITSGNCQSVSDSEAAPDTEETIEEIRVYGDKSLGRLRQEAYDAEEIFFDSFNALNSDDDLDIHCYREAVTGSRLKRRVCKPNYLKRLEAEATRQMMLSLQAGGAGSYLEPVWRVRQKDEQMQEEMQRLAGENPKLLEALQEFADMKQAYERERKARCEGRIILCR